MEIVTKVMEKSWKFVGKNVYEPCEDSWYFLIWTNLWFVLTWELNSALWKKLS